MRTGKPWETTYRLRLDDGQQRVVTGRGRPRTDTDGKVIGISGTVQDITAQAKVQESLVIAREDALAASRAKSQFLANMSHEIRTPMNGVLGMAGLLADTELSAEQREYLDIVQSSAHGLLSVINHILDISKIEAGKMELESVPLSLRNTLEDVLRTHVATAHGKGLELICEIDPRVVDDRLGDPVRLRQIVSNLLGNAIKFTDRGGVVAQIAQAAGSCPNQFQLVIEDSGIGIEASSFDRIFEAFSQVDGSTTRHFGGTGLGLTISHQIAHLMGGSLRVESEVGRGSRFVATLSMPQFQDGDARAASVPIPARRILLVDEHQRFRRSLRLLLEELGQHVVEADGVGSALELLNTPAEIDIVMVDSDLTPVAGSPLAIKLANSPSLRAVLLHSAAPESAPTLDVAALFSARLMKPVGRSLLVAALLATQGRPSETPAWRPARAVEPRAGRGSGSNGQFVVLLAEDNPVNRLLARRILAKADFLVVEATDGCEAVRAFEDGRFDAIVMDIQMPRLDGLDATRQIRSLERRRGGHTPIVALTANAMEGDQDKCLAAGADAYLPKPLDRQRLLDLLHRMIDRAELG